MKNIYLSGSVFRKLLLIFTAVLLAGCNRDRNNPGWDYFPDMFYSTAYETYAPNPNFKDGMTMRAPVEGTVPRDFTPFEYTIAAESRRLAGIELKNPFLPTDEILNRGKIIYTTFCLGCHGISGDGNGLLYTRGLYPLKPRSLTGNTAAELKDGEIFHTITLGFGSMGAHGSQVLADDRWKLILYIRKLQNEGVKSAEK